MSSVAPLLIWIICIGISALALGLLIREGGVDWIFQTEGFNNVVPIRITTCPATTTSHVTADGDTNCCDGDIIDKQCNGTTLCSLSPKPPHDLMSCTDWIMKEWKARSDRFCAPSMPYYFGPLNRKGGSTEGCSESPPMENGSIPRDQGMAKCKIYKNSTDDYANADSCFNIRAKDNFVAPMPSATKVIIPIGRLPALLHATYMPTNESSVTPVSCYEWERARVFLDAWDPSGKITLQYASQKDTNYQLFCGASKAYYVDGTLSNSSGPTPYDNGKRYRVNDQVSLNNNVYKMVESAGAAGYSPEREGDKLWKQIGGGDSRCYVNGEKLGRPVPHAKNPSWISQKYTREECEKLQGRYWDLHGAFFCSIPDAKGSFKKTTYDLFCSPNPAAMPEN